VQKLLIDENLSPSLVAQANAKGFVCAHVNHLRLTGLKDWELKATILEGDWTFITNNGMDSHGPAKNPEATVFPFTLGSSVSMLRVLRRHPDASPPRPVWYSMTI
jgi:hypothetical protein